MIPYFAVAVLSSLSSAFSALVRHIPRYGSEDSNLRVSSRWTPFDFLAIAILVVFSALRRGVGTDYGLYSAIYSRLNGLTWEEALRETPQEIGFTSLSLILHVFSEDPSILFWATSILTVLPFYAAIKALSQQPAFSTLLYVLLGYYLVPLNIVRQGMAMALNFYSLRYLSTSPIKFFCINIIASTLHVSVIPVFVLQWILRKKSPSRRLLIFTTGLTAILLVSLNAFSWAQSFAGYLNPRYETYLTVTPSNDSAVGIGTYILIAVRIVTVVYSLSLPRTKNLELLQVLLIISIPLQACAIIAPPIGRLEYYFSAVAIILLPSQIELTRNRVKHRAIFIIAAIMYFTMFLRSFGGLLPYHI